VDDLLTARYVTTSSVLVIDRELGFMFALSQALRKRRIGAIPCCSVAEAEALLARLQPDLGVLVINCSCPGVCAFATKLRRLQSRLRVVGITSTGRQCRQCGQCLDATIRDPEDRWPEGIERCAEMVDSLRQNAYQI
jgi:two-component SAPR family response regulator